MRMPKNLIKEPIRDYLEPRLEALVKKAQSKKLRAKRITQLEILKHLPVSPKRIARASFAKNLFQTERSLKVLNGVSRRILRSVIGGDKARLNRAHRMAAHAFLTYNLIEHTKMGHTPVSAKRYYQILEQLERELPSYMNKNSWLKKYDDWGALRGLVRTMPQIKERVRNARAERKEVDVQVIMNKESEPRNRYFRETTDVLDIAKVVFEGAMYEAIGDPKKRDLYDKKFEIAAREILRLESENLPKLAYPFERNPFGGHL